MPTQSPVVHALINACASRATLGIEFFRYLIAQQDWPIIHLFTELYVEKHNKSPLTLREINSLYKDSDPNNAYEFFDYIYIHQKTIFAVAENPNKATNQKTLANEWLCTIWVMLKHVDLSHKWTRLLDKYLDTYKALIGRSANSLIELEEVTRLLNNPHASIDNCLPHLLKLGFRPAEPLRYYIAMANCPSNTAQIIPYLETVSQEGVSAIFSELVHSLVSDRCVNGVKESIDALKKLELEPKGAIPIVLPILSDAFFLLPNKRQLKKRAELSKLLRFSISTYPTAQIILANHLANQKRSFHSLVSSLTY